MGTQSPRGHCSTERGISGKGAAASRLETRLNEVMNSEMHKWFLGKMSPGEMAARQRAAEEFKKRYAQ